MTQIHATSNAAAIKAALGKGWAIIRRRPGLYVATYQGQVMKTGDLTAVRHWAAVWIADMASADAPA
jgi:hypothetical protein